jgi:hypothetical protein
MVQGSRRPIEPEQPCARTRKVRGLTFVLTGKFKQPALEISFKNTLGEVAKCPFSLRLVIFSSFSSAMTHRIALGAWSPSQRGAAAALIEETPGSLRVPGILFVVSSKALLESCHL